MNESLPRLEEFCSIYLDDINIYSTCIQKHLEHLHTILFYYWGCIVSVKRPECDFLKSSLHLLNHVISPGGVASDPPKFLPSMTWQLPPISCTFIPFSGVQTSINGLYKNIPQYAPLQLICWAPMLSSIGVPLSNRHLIL